VHPFEVYDDPSGNIYLTNGTTSLNGTLQPATIISINPNNGDQALLASGGYLSSPVAVLTIPVPEPTILSLLAIGGFALLRRRVAGAKS
jgi:hypothetical protein